MTDSDGLRKIKPLASIGSGMEPADAQAVVGRSDPSFNAERIDTAAHHDRRRIIESLCQVVSAYEFGRAVKQTGPRQRVAPALSAKCDESMVFRRHLEIVRDSPPDTGDTAIDWNGMFLAVASVSLYEVAPRTGVVQVAKVYRDRNADLLDWVEQSDREARQVLYMDLIETALLQEHLHFFGNGFGRNNRERSERPRPARANRGESSERALLQRARG